MFEPPNFNPTHCDRGYFSWCERAKLLAVDNIRNGIDVYQVNGGDVQHIINIHMYERASAVKHMDFALSGSILITTGEAGRIRFWKLPEGLELAGSLVHAGDPGKFRYFKDCRIRPHHVTSIQRHSSDQGEDGTSNLKIIK